MNIQESLNRLGFTEEWVDFGIVTEEYLLELYREILESEDKNAEHYRGWAFAEYLKSKSSLTNSEINNILRLKDAGPDKCDLKLDRIFSLLHSNLLSDTQLNELGDLAEVNERPLQKLYKRKKLIRSIKDKGIDANFSQITDFNDPDVNDFVISSKDIKLEHINWFKDYASNKRIRNIAMQMASNRKYTKRA